MSPRFHRRHHAVGYGHEGIACGYNCGCNLGVVSPCRHMVFKTASWNPAVEPIGIYQKIEGKPYGDGFLPQHWLAFVRIAQRLSLRGGVQPAMSPRFDGADQ